MYFQWSECMRYLSTLTFLLINAAVSHLCQAGIVLDSNGFVTQATLEVSGVSYDVTLTKGTYDSVDSQFTLSDELWFGDQSLASDFGNALKDSLNASTESLSTQPFYWFAYQADQRTSSAQITATGVYEYNGNWILSASSNFPSTNDAYFASVGNPNVPEPSTAIAMGLLGVLGFAGNRRRRRQS